MTQRSKFLKSLKSHPGVPIAAILSLAGFAAGFHFGGSFGRGLAGMAIMTGRNFNN